MVSNAHRQALWAAAAIVLAGFLLRLWVAPSYGYSGYDGDLHEQKQAAHRALTRGIHETYTANWENDPGLSGKKWDGGYYVDYPPVIFHLRAATSRVYEFFEPEAFALWDSEHNFFELLATDLEERLAQSRGFTVMIKLPGIVADALISLALFLFVSRMWRPGLGLAAAAAYALNPGVIFNSAFWGQHDAVWGLFIILSLWLLHRGRPELSWVFLMLAVLTKPQAIPFVPLVLTVSFWQCSPRRLVYAALASLGTFGLVWLPYIIHGTYWTSFSSITISTLVGEPYLSLNAANLWWLLSAAKGAAIPSSTSLLRVVELRNLGLLAFIASYLFIIFRLRGGLSERSDLLFLAAASVGMAFFTLSTNLHENHMYVVIPLACFALGLGREIRALVGVLSVTLLANLALFDSAVTRPLTAVFGRPLPLREVSLMVAAVNVGGFAVLIWSYWRHTRPPRPGSGG